MRDCMKKAPYLLLLLINPLLGVIYNLLNNRVHDAIDLSTFLDRNIPFLPIFVIPYITWYAYFFGYLIYFCFKDTKVFLKVWVLNIIAHLICFVIYYYFQTTVNRPLLIGDNFLYSLIRWIYNNDHPYNCLPSIHVLTTFLIMLTSLHIKNKHIIHTIIIQFIGTLIILSTLFVKQHIIFDVVSSMLIVLILYGATFEILSIRLVKKPRAVYVKNTMD